MYDYSTRSGCKFGQNERLKEQNMKFISSSSIILVSRSCAFFLLCSRYGACRRRLYLWILLKEGLYKKEKTKLWLYILYMCFCRTFSVSIFSTVYVWMFNRLPSKKCCYHSCYLVGFDLLPPSQYNKMEWVTKKKGIVVRRNWKCMRGWDRFLIGKKRVLLAPKFGC